MECDDRCEYQEKVRQVVEDGGGGEGPGIRYLALKHPGALYR